MTTTDDTAAELPDASTIHERGLERAKRIDKAHLDAALHEHPTTALAVAFQAAADALHEEADAAAEARKRGHQSLTKDLRNTAGRIVGIAQDLMELSKLEPAADVEPKTDIGSYSASYDLRQPYTPATDPVIEQADVTEHLARLEAERGADWPRETDGSPAPGTADDVKAYLRGDTDTLPADDAVTITNPTAEDVRAVLNFETPPSANPFLDPAPYVPQVRPPFPGAELHAYGYEALMTPVKADLVPAHWSWSQLTTLEDCGLKYRGQRLEGVPQQPQWANVGGTTFHTVTEAFDRGAYAAGGADLLPEVHPELIKQRWDAAFAAEIQRVAAQTGIEPGERMDNWRASSGGKEGYTWWLIEGERMLEIYIHNRRKLDKAAREAGTLAVPLLLPLFGVPGNTEAVPAIEYEYERKIFGPVGELTIKGVIDRAYRCSDGTIMVKDMKTGAMAPQTAQLGEYAWAIVDMIQATGTPFDGEIRACFYDARKGLFTDPIDVLTEHPREEYVYRYSMAETARRGGVFMPHRTPFCNGCSIAYACPVKGGA